MISKKHKKTCTLLSYIEHLFILVLAVTGCASISAFASLLGIPIAITSSTAGLKICAITAGIKSKIKKKEKKHNKIVLLGKTKLNTVEVLISRALINSFISHDEFISINSVKNMMIWKQKSKTLIIDKYVWYNKKKKLIPEKEFTKTNYQRLQKALVYIQSNLIDSDGNMYLTVKSLIVK